MALLTDEVRAFIGVESPVLTVPEPVERGAVRRFAQAIMDEDPIYGAEAPAERYGGPVAPLLFPSFMIRRPLGAPDLLTERAADPDFDASAGFASDGLPELPLNLALLNGGLDVEFHRYARHGETITVKSRYLDIVERASKSGPMLLVITQSDYRTAGGELLLRVRRTMIRR
jgi:hypothetical protein